MQQEKKALPDRGAGPRPWSVPVFKYIYYTGADRYMKSRTGPHTVVYSQVRRLLLFIYLSFLKLLGVTQVDG